MLPVTLLRCQFEKESVADCLSPRSFKDAASFPRFPSTGQGKYEAFRKTQLFQEADNVRLSRLSEAVIQSLCGASVHVHE